VGKRSSNKVEVFAKDSCAGALGSVQTSAGAFEELPEFETEKFASEDSNSWVRLPWAVEELELELREPGRVLRRAF
jgi:hypothetical protein